MNCASQLEQSNTRVHPERLRSRKAPGSQTDRDKRNPISGAMSVDVRTGNGSGFLADCLITLNTCCATDDVQVSPLDGTGFEH